MRELIEVKQAPNRPDLKLVFKTTPRQQLQAVIVSKLLKQKNPPKNVLLMKILSRKNFVVEPKFYNSICN